MENPFKKILQDEKLPDYLKDKVIDNLNIIKLSLDVSDLYAVQVPKTIQSIVAEKNKDKEQELIKEILEKQKNGKNL